jgi:hypothetical protein
MTVTISISQRKATSIGVKPGGRGNAMADFGGLEDIIELDAVDVTTTR